MTKDGPLPSASRPSCRSIQASALLGRGMRGEAADEGDLRVVAEVDGELHIVVGELPDDDATVGRSRGGPVGQLCGHVQIVALVDANVWAFTHVRSEYSSRFQR